MYNAPRAATVTATEESVVWCVDRKTFRKVVIKSRIERSKKYCNFLKEVKIFANITDEERSQLADGLMPCEFADGDVVINQGDNNRDMFKFYLVVGGEASVSITRGNKEAVVACVKITDYFGERALIEHKPRAATVTAAGALQLASMDYQTFERLMGRTLSPASLWMLLSLLIRRFQTIFNVPNAIFLSPFQYHKHIRYAHLPSQH